MDFVRSYGTSRLISSRNKDIQAEMNMKEMNIETKDIGMNTLKTKKKRKASNKFKRCCSNEHEHMIAKNYYTMYP